MSDRVLPIKNLTDGDLFDDSDSEDQSAQEKLPKIISK
jgi:hypothetical protein